MDEVQKYKSSNFVTSFEGEQVDSKDHLYKSKFSIKKQTKNRRVLRGDWPHHVIKHYEQTFHKWNGWYWCLHKETNRNIVESSEIGLNI